MRDVFNLIPADVGRPLLDINSRLEETDLVADPERVLERLQPVVREVETEEGQWSLMERMFGVSAEEVLGRPLPEVTRAPPRRSACCSTPCSAARSAAARRARTRRCSGAGTARG